MKKSIKFLLNVSLSLMSISLFAQSTTDFRTWAHTPPMGWNSYNSFGANV